MSGVGFRSVPGLILAAGCLALAAAGPPPDDPLKPLGLIRAGRYLVLDGEAEPLKKFGDVRLKAAAYETAVFDRRDLDLGAGLAAELNQDLRALDQRINELGMQLGNHPRRMSGPQRYSLQSLQAERAGLQTTRNGLRAELNTLRAKTSNPKVVKTLDDKVRQARDACLPAVKEHRSLVDAVEARYAELSRDPKARAALVTAGKGTGGALRLGPSPEWSRMVKEFRSLEIHTGQTAPTGPRAKAADSKRKARARR